MKLLKNPYKQLPYHTLVKEKCPWLADMTSHVKNRIAEFYKFMQAEANSDGQPELTDQQYLLERFRFNREHNMHYGNFKILKYWVIMFKINVLYLMIGQWKFTQFDVILYNYFRDADLSKWSHQSVKWVLMYNTGTAPSILPHEKTSKWYVSYKEGDNIKDEFYTNMFRTYFILLDDALRNIKQLDLSLPDDNVFSKPPQFPSIVSVNPSDPICGHVCTSELSFLLRVYRAKRYINNRDTILEKTHTYHTKGAAKEAYRTKQKEYRTQHKDRLNQYFKEYRIKNKDKLTARQKKYASEHHDEIRAKNKKRYAEHREEALARSKLYRDANKEQLKAKHQSYYYTNIDTIKKKAKAYRDTHKDIIKAQNDRYRAENRDEISRRRKAVADEKRAAGYRYRFVQETGKHQWVFVGNTPAKQSPPTQKQIVAREYARAYRQKNKEKLSAMQAEYKAKRRAGYQRILNPETGKKEWTFVGTTKPDIKH